MQVLGKTGIYSEKLFYIYEILNDNKRNNVK